MYGALVAVAQATTEQFVLPGWAVITGMIATIGVSFTVLWNWLARLIDREIEYKVDEKLGERMEKYEQRQVQIMKDVAYIKGCLDSLSDR